VQIAETYLAADESVDADVYVNKASPLMYAVTVWSVQLRYRVTLSRVLDARRKFLDAAAHYYELSQTANEQVQAGDLLDLLGMAVTCAILAEAGPQRTRILGTLYVERRWGEESPLALALLPPPLLLLPILLVATHSPPQVQG
jgi:COP9 signalosome complex subunit 4